MIALYDTNSNMLLGEVTEAQFTVMQEWLEEEGADDEDYYINEATVELLREKGADAGLLAVLQRAIAATGEADIRWTSDDEGV